MRQPYSSKCRTNLTSGAWLRQGNAGFTPIHRSKKLTKAFEDANRLLTVCQPAPSTTSKVARAMSR